MPSNERKTLLNAEPKKSAVFTCARRYSKAHKCINSGAGLLALIWTVVITSSAQFIKQCWTYYYPDKYLPQYFVGYAILMCFYLLAGFLADVKLGRYVAINGSGFILLFLIAIEFLILSITLALALVKFKKDYSILFDVFVIPITIVRVMFIANIIQYGTDQLHDSPTDHQSLFIHWYMWAYMLGQLIARVTAAIDFFDERSTTSVVLGSTMLAIFATVAFFLFLVSLYIVKYQHQCFFVDKIRMNPYKCVFNVTKFAYKHRTPLRRSAFTYCESKIPSGLDLAKERYGGPYTTEQVEDVKVFYEILKILVALCPTYFSHMSAISGEGSTPKQFFPSQFTNTTGVGKTNVEFLLHNKILEYLLMVIYLTLYLCIIRPALLQYIPGILKRMGIGVVLNILAITLTFISAELGGSNSQSLSPAEQNTSQSVTHNGELTFTIIITIVSSVSYMIISITTYELICSQSPRFMKGFLVGLFLSLQGAFSLFAYIVEYITLKSLSFSGCGILYYIIHIIIGGFGVLLFVQVARKYKYRKRDDICPVYQYVDDYYSKLIQHHR